METGDCPARNKPIGQQRTERKERGLRLLAEILPANAPVAVPPARIGRVFRPYHITAYE